MKHGSIGKRVGAVLGCLATAAGIALVPAQPASAAYCDTDARLPSMIDHKIFLVNGTNNAYCDGPATITSDVELERFFTAANGWKVVGTGTRTEANVQYVMADAYFDCVGHGPTVHVRTQGRGRFLPVGGGPSTHEETDTSASREIRCGESGIPVIQT